MRLVGHVCREDGEERLTLTFVGRACTLQRNRRKNEARSQIRAALNMSLTRGFTLAIIISPETTGQDARPLSAHDRMD